MFFLTLQKIGIIYLKRNNQKDFEREFDEISVQLKTYHCIHFVGLQARKWSRSKTLWFLDSGAIENNKHRTLNSPISVGFKRTPSDTKSYWKPPPPADPLRLCGFNL